MAASYLGISEYLLVSLGISESSHYRLRVENSELSPFYPCATTDYELRIVTVYLYVGATFRAESCTNYLHTTPLACTLSQKILLCPSSVPCPLSPFYTVFHYSLRVENSDCLFVCGSNVS